MYLALRTCHMYKRGRGRLLTDMCACTCGAQVWDRDERPRQLAADFIGGLVLAPNAHWRQNRELFRAFFANASLKQMQPMVHARVDQLLQRLELLAGGGRAFDAQPLFQALTLDVIGCAAFGFDFGCVRDEQSAYREAFEGCMAHLMHRLVSPLPYWRWCRTAGVRAYEQHLQLLRDAVRARLAVYRAEPHADDSLLAHVVRAEQRGELAGWLQDEAALVVQMLTMLSAGHDTATGALCWLMHFVTSAAPHVRQQLQAELAPLPAGFDPEAHALPWLSACLKETLRLRPSVAADGRQLREARELTWTGAHGRTCRSMCAAGQVVLLSPYVTHQQADLWPAPEQFRPERFLPGAPPPPHPYAYVPFGAGPRRCIGERFALAQLKIAAARMLQRFELEPAPDAPPVRVRHAINLRVAPSLMMVARPRPPPAQ